MISVVKNAEIASFSDLITYFHIDIAAIIGYNLFEDVIIMATLFETAIVEKRNVLNELRSNNMNLQELRFFSIYLAKSIRMIFLQELFGSL